MSAKKSDEPGNSLSEQFEILSDTHRRRILMVVAQQNPQDEADLPEQVVEEAHEKDNAALEHLKVQFHHNHLPKLADAGFINWDSVSGTVTRGPRFKEIKPLLGLMHDHQDELPDDRL